jgi:hypothetical protein
LDSFVEAPAQIEPSTEDLLGIALQGYRPLPSAEEAGKAMLKSHKPADPGTLPPVHGTENPWEEISEEPHVLLNETEPGQNTLGEVRNLFSNLGEAADQERSQATWSDPDAAPKEAKQHGELAALFDED